jgi:DNA-binding NarL/FixJ family response regulator
VAPLVRILLVEDFEPFRGFLRSALQRRTNFKVVGEAVDGFEAIQKAKDLQPDLILLDIGLPKLSGLAAAEQIRVLAPDAKILVVSLESSPTAVEEAFRLGALGYIHKLRTDLDLTPAIEAVLAGKQFVSSDLGFSVSPKIQRRHELQFWSNETVFLESATRFLAGALRADGAVIVLATASHGKKLFQRLKAESFDMDGAIRRGAYISLDATDTLSKIMKNGLPDERRLSEIMGSVLESAVKARKNAHSPVAFMGEMAGILCAEGNTNGAMKLETKNGNDLLERYDVDLLCPYPMSASQRAGNQDGLKTICAQHTAVFSQ